MQICSQREVLLAGSCVWIVLEGNVVEDTHRVVSSEGWSRKSGAGGSGLEDCWRTGGEPSLIHTSLSVDVSFVPMEQVRLRHWLEGHQRNMDEARPCC